MLRLTRQRGIYLLPNLFTTAALFSGFYSIIYSMQGNFGVASIAIYIAMLADGLDGRIARMTNTQSDFGVQYDSLADMVNFGVAPSILAFSWQLREMGKLGWLAAFIYTAGCALRLARFNTQVATADKRYFQGLSSTASAGVMAGCGWCFHEMSLGAYGLNYAVAFLSLMLGILMVSNIRFRSFKEIQYREKIPFYSSLMVVLIFVAVSIEPAKIFFGVFLLYALSGPIETIYSLRRFRMLRRKARAKVSKQ